MSRDFSRQSAAALRLRMQGHLAMAGEELRGSGEAIREELRPINLIRRHPFIVAAIGAGTGLLVARFLLRRKPASASLAAPPPASTIRSRLRIGLTSGIAALLGSRLVSNLVLGAVSKAVDHRRGR